MKVQSAQQFLKFLPLITLAKTSLQETIDFLKVNWDDKTINDLINLIDKRTEQLIQNPNIGPKLPNSEFRRLIIHKYLTLFYTFEQNQITILLSWDNRQNPETLETKLLFRK